MKITKFNKDALESIVNLNKMKRGAADMELDYDMVIKTIQKSIENKETMAYGLK
jgi:hypothetical protein